MTVANYTTKMKEICNALGSINVIMDDDEMVQICLCGLAPWYEPIQTAICMREKPPSFFDLQSMLMVKENHAGASRSIVGIVATKKASSRRRRLIEHVRIM